MRASELIQKKRDGGELTREEIAFLLDGRAVPDYQITAWLMAVFFRGMTPAETAALTEVMLGSGAALDLGDIPGRKVDKHSTGGVGDKTSLVLAPVAAAAGLVVPMISGRGLGHTGGTLDKLEAIPGFRVGLSLEEFRAALREVGCGLIGQTAEIAPADRRLYALRDVTGTVESIPLITSSILSKKLAEGIDALVLDVKVGSGAFMKDLGRATELAETMVAIATRIGKKCVALLTDMDQPLGLAVGNALEVAESIETLRGRGPADFTALCRELAAWMLMLGEKAKDLDAGRRRYDELIANGQAAEKFRQIIARQGGDPRVVDDPGRLPQAARRHEVASPAAGYVARIQAEQVGRAAMRLGAGRERIEDRIDPAVGVVLRKKVGERVERGEPLAALHVNDEARAAEAAAMLTGAYTIAAERPQPNPLVLKTLS